MTQTPAFLLLCPIVCAASALPCGAADVAPDAWIGRLNYAWDDSIDRPIYGDWIDESSLEWGKRDGWRKLDRDFEALLGMTEEQIMAVMPETNGAPSVGCPNCEDNAQDYQFKWSIHEPEHMSCSYCNHTYPSATYPMDRHVTVMAPSGKKIAFTYYEHDDGRQHFFTAGINQLKLDYFDSAASHYAIRYHLTGEEKYARLAAVILVHLAKRYPDFVIRYDHPNRNLTFYDGRLNGSHLPNRRVARPSRWNWWMYDDIPHRLLLAFDLIYKSPSLATVASQYSIDIERDVVKGFFHDAAEGTLLYNEDAGNMAPSYWQGLVMAGRITGAPDYCHVVMSRLERFVRDNFYFDGLWKEPALSYHRQTVSGLESSVVERLDGYQDPPGFRSGFDQQVYSEPFSKQALLDRYNLTNGSDPRLTLPNGYAMGLGDSWMLGRAATPATIDSFLLPALGVAALVGEKRQPDQIQLRLVWPGNAGHGHDDTLSLSLFGHGREVMSDLGYTHTRYRAWTLCAPSHNLVVVDHGGQQASSYDRSGQLIHAAKKGDSYQDFGRGDILYMDIDNPRVQLIDVDGRRANHGNPYRRTSFLIQSGDDHHYVADFFDVAGGSNYDYFLHGSAEKEEDVTFSAEDQRGLAVTDQPLAPQEYLDTWEAPAHESDWGRLHERYFSYGFLRETQRVENPSHGYVRAAFGGAGSPLYVHVPADADQRVFTGKASSVRQAGFDNNALLEERFRRFVVLRKTSPEPAAASFAAVIEPCRKQSRILRVTRPHAHVLRIVLDDRVDYVFRDLRDPFTTEEQGTTLRMRGAYGHASIRDGKLVHHHIVGAMVAVGETTAATGDPFSRIVAKRVNKKELTFEPGSPAEWTEAEDLGSFVRLDFSPHHRYGYFRNTLDPATGRLETQGPLGFSLTPDGGTMFRSFPQYRFAGPAQVTFFPTTYSAGP